MEADRIEIAIPNWLVNRDHLSPGDLINLHVPFAHAEEVQDQGVVVKAHWDEGMQAQICAMELKGSVGYADRVFVRMDLRRVEFAAEDSDLLRRILKDLLLLKKGVLIYWDHLIPFFSRIARYPQADFPQLKEVVMQDVRRYIQGNVEGLAALFEQASSGSESLADTLDLEALRTHVESEIQAELFEATFPASQVRSYIDSIKNLENRLYLNYNLAVLSCAHSLAV